MAITEGEQKIIDLLKDLKKLQKGMYARQIDIDTAMAKEEL